MLTLLSFLSHMNTEKLIYLTCTDQLYRLKSKANEETLCIVFVGIEFRFKVVKICVDLCSSNNRRCRNPLVPKLARTSKERYNNSIACLNVPLRGNIIHIVNINTTRF